MSLRPDLLRDFLAKLLPDKGNYVGVWFPVPKKPRQKSVATIEELASLLARMDELGYDTYHACSSFKTNENRTQENVEAVRSLWLDIDIAPKSPYANASDAASAVVSFCRSVSLPIPVFVGSGYGLHCYWFFTSSLVRSEWLPYAQGLKNLCAEKGLVIDNSRTADASSILRTPGTRNFKKPDAPKEVQWDGKAIEHSWGTFSKLVSSNRIAFNLQNANLSGKATKHSKLLQAALNLSSYEESYSDRVAEGCAQIRDIKETRGNVSEPLWYAGLGVFAFCVDGREKAHAYSQGHPNYTYEETERKFNQASDATTGASLCVRFNSLNPRLCMECPHRGKINSPIVLGYQNAITVSDNSTSVSDTGVIDELVNGHKVNFPTLMSPFAWNEDHSLVIQSENRRGTKVEQIISKYPIYLEAINKSEASGEDLNVNYVFAHLLPKEGWRQFSIPAATFVGSLGAQEFARHGANVSDWPTFKKAVGMMVDEHNLSNSMGVQYQQFGWKESNFLIGDRLYSETNGVERVIVADTLLRRARHLRPAAGGSLARWATAAGRLFAPGLETHSLALAAAPAAPLMKFFSTDEGGAILHITTEESGTGKTTSLATAMSFWGHWEGLRLTTDDTKISKGLILGTLKHLPVAWDELTARDPQAMAEFIHMFTEGRDRNRATSSGDLRDSYLNWQTIMLSAANRSVRESLTSSPTDVAMGWRVMEFNSEKVPELSREIDEIKNILVANCGHAGDRYLRYIVDPKVIAYITWALTERQYLINQRYNFDSKHRFWVRSLSCIWVAIELCNKLEIFECAPERIVDWACKQLLEFKFEETKHVKAVRLLVDFLDTFRDQTLVVNNSNSDLIVAEPKRGRLIIRREQDSQTIYIAADYFDTWVSKGGYSLRETYRELIKLGIMEGTHKHLVLGRHTVFATGKIACWKIRADSKAFIGEEQTKVEEVEKGKILKLPMNKLKRKTK